MTSNNNVEGNNRLTKLKRRNIPVYLLKLITFFKLLLVEHARDTLFVVTLLNKTRIGNALIKPSKPILKECQSLQLPLFK